MSALPENEQNVDGCFKVAIQSGAVQYNALGLMKLIIVTISAGREKQKAMHN